MAEVRELIDSMKVDINFRRDRARVEREVFTAEFNKKMEMLDLLEEYANLLDETNNLKVKTGIEEV
jgi:hypothetical protein